MAALNQIQSPLVSSIDKGLMRYISVWRTAKTITATICHGKCNGITISNAVQTTFLAMCIGYNAAAAAACCYDTQKKHKGLNAAAL